MRKARRVKQEEGVTLIILVVTIVVILLLAGITVDVAFSENGIIKSALGLQDKIYSEIETDETRMNQLQGEITNGSIEGGGGVIPDSNSIGDGGEGAGSEEATPEKPRVEVRGEQGEEGYYRSDVEIQVTASDRADNLTYTVKGTGIEQGNVSTETSIGNVRTHEKPRVEGITDWTKAEIKETEETSVTITVSQPVKVADGTNANLEPNNTGSTVRIEVIDPDENGYGTKIKVTVTGGTGDGEETMVVPEGTLIDQYGEPVETIRKEGITVDNTKPGVGAIETPGEQNIKKEDTFIEIVITPTEQPVIRNLLMLLVMLKRWILFIGMCWDYH